MSKKYLKRWFIATLIRAAKTTGEVLLSYITVGQAINDINWTQMLFVSLGSIFYTFIFALKGLPEVQNDELLSDIVDEYGGDDEQ